MYVCIVATVDVVNLPCNKNSNFFENSEINKIPNVTIVVTTNSNETEEYGGTRVILSEQFSNLICTLNFPFSP